VHIYKSRFLVRGEVWFDHEPDHTPVDWILYRQRSRPVPGARWEFFYTILLDLTQSAEDLLGAMSKSAGYKIRRAGERDGILCESRCPASFEDLDEFEKTYERFAAIKGLEPLDRPLLNQLVKDGALEVSVARDAKGLPLVHHVYYRDGRRSCLMHCVSLYQMLAESSARNAMGRANRYLFWQDALRHKEEGLEIFDFGGWYPGHTNQALLDINRFKEEFGGRITREYNCQQVCSLKAWLLLRIAALLGCGRRISARFPLVGRPFTLRRPRLVGVGASPAPLLAGP